MVDLTELRELAGWVSINVDDDDGVRIQNAVAEIERLRAALRHVTEAKMPGEARTIARVALGELGVGALLVVEQRED